VLEPCPTLNMIKSVSDIVATITLICRSRSDHEKRKRQTNLAVRIRGNLDVVVDVTEDIRFRAGRKHHYANVHSFQERSPEGLVQLSVSRVRSGVKAHG
jgi:hypothetical protein